MIDVTFGSIRNKPQFDVLREYMERLETTRQEEAEDD